MSKRIGSIVSLIFGVFGVLGCIVVVVISWSVASRLHLASEGLFHGIEHAIGTARQQVARVSDRVDALKLDAQAIDDRIKSRDEAEVAKRMTSNLPIEKSVDRIAVGLEQADHWLDVVESSVQIVQQVIAAGSELGIPTGTDALPRLLKDVSSVRNAYPAGLLDGVWPSSPYQPWCERIESATPRDWTMTRHCGCPPEKKHCRSPKSFR